MSRPATSVTIDSAPFARAAQRLIATSKKSAADLMRQQGKLIIVDAVKITPPNQNFRYARRLGEMAIRADLGRLFQSSQASSATTDLAGIHRKNRNRSGRVARNVDRVKAKGLVAYRNEVLARVGKLAAGWANAAQSLGATLPDWIKRHNRPGFARITQSGGTTTLTLANQGVYTGGRIRADLERRLGYAIRKRAGAINRQVDHFLKRNAAVCGFR
jgi:hypothetical protein